jgi:uncharacterized protein
MVHRPGELAKKELTPLFRILMDADACPVKEDTFRVAKRYGLEVVVVSNAPLSLPTASWIVPIVVEKEFDAVDHWIVESLRADDIVITNDLPLAARCVEKGGRVIDPRGKILSEENIGEALAHRELMAELRQRGELNLGPKKREKKHRSQFLSSLDQVIHQVLKAKRGR